MNADPYTPRPMTVELQDETGTVLAEIPLLPLTWSQWELLGAEVPPPDKAHYQQVHFQDGHKQLVLDEDAYRAAVNAAEVERSLWRLAAALQGGGGFPALGAMPLEDAVEVVRGWEVGIVHGLLRALRGNAYAQEVRLLAAGRNFQRGA